MAPVVDDLVDATEAARLLGLRQRNSVATYARRYPDFPAPAIDRGARRARFWRRDEIEAWRARHPQPHRAPR